MKFKLTEPEEAQLIGLLTQEFGEFTDASEQLFDLIAKEALPAFLEGALDLESRRRLLLHDDIELRKQLLPEIEKRLIGLAKESEPHAELVLSCDLPATCAALKNLPVEDGLGMINAMTAILREAKKKPGRTHDILSCTVPEALALIAEKNSTEAFKPAMLQEIGNQLLEGKKPQQVVVSAIRFRSPSPWNEAEWSSVRAASNKGLAPLPQR